MREHIIVDIDNTIATLGNRHHYSWSLVELDNPIEFSINLIVNSGYGLIFITGRAEGYKNDPTCGREATQRWLNKHVGDYELLLMRDPFDFRKSTLLKRDLYETHVKDKYKIAFAIDDDTSVCEMYNSLNIPTLNIKL